MKDYIEEAIEAFGENVSRGATTPAKHNLHIINESSPKLSKAQAELFHHIVAKLLYVAKRCRLDVQLAIAFLTTRVKDPTAEDWNKLKQILQYLHRTIDKFLTLRANDISIMDTYIDAAYPVHLDMKSHTGGIVTLRRGAVMSKSQKQKLNTKSSTEAELVGFSDYTPNSLWASKFLDKQGYTIQQNIVHQDNQSAMKLETNGRRSCGQKSRHIDIRYFFLKDKIQSGDIKVEYCPTEAMLADFLTKPLQGALFNKMKDAIMGRIDIETFRKLTSVSKERVEE